MSDPVVLLSTGDVVGPAGGVTDNSMVLFSGTSGKLIKGNNAVVTAAGLALLDDVDAAAQRATLGLGTAATATLTTSNIDGTAGRVTKVGDFGLGAVAYGPYGQDLNAYKTSGFYRVTSGNGTISNSPMGGNGEVILLVTNASDISSQTSWNYITGAMYTRTNWGADWTPWREIALTDSPAFTGVPTAPTPSIGTRSTAIATMQNFANEFGSSLAANGWQKLPSGLIIQWGQTATIPQGANVITLPIAFIGANLAVVITATAVGGSGQSHDAVTSRGLTSFTLTNSSNISSPFNWLAIGY